jgi:hypothetical protein
MGASVSSTVKIAIETLSASSTSSANIGAREQRFRQPLADVLLAPPRERPHLVERLPRDDPDEVGPLALAERLPGHVCRSAANAIPQMKYPATLNHDVGILQ